MDFTIPAIVEDTRARIAAFVEREILPLESDPTAYDAHENIAPAPLAALRAKAKAQGLWCRRAAQFDIGILYSNVPPS